MATVSQLAAQGVTRVRRPLWVNGAYLEITGVWATLYDPVGYEALEADAPAKPYTFCVPLIEDDDFEPVEPSR